MKRIAKLPKSPYARITHFLSGNSKQRRKLMRALMREGAGWIISMGGGRRMKRRFGGHDGPTEWETDNYYSHGGGGHLPEGTPWRQALRWLASRPKPQKLYRNSRLG